ncbi:MAG TPA: hypothetical protein PK105_06700 [Rectinema sp.]|nr:hypothetical protein [Rectinema sp.]HPK79791.1 hypothetical protein [Rectinema sp.]
MRTRLHLFDNLGFHAQPGSGINLEDKAIAGFYLDIVLEHKRGLLHGNG